MFVSRQFCRATNAASVVRFASSKTPKADGHDAARPMRATGGEPQMLNPILLFFFFFDFL